MGDPDLGISAVEPPRARVLPDSGVRRHRPITGTSGVLLFVCMFLPAVKGCSSPIVPFELPPFIPPYLFGLAFAALALSRTRRALVAGNTALRIISVLVVLAGIALVLIEPRVGIVEVGLGLALVATVGLAPVSERRIAVSGVVVGAVCTTWFGLWSATPDALLGIYLSFASSVGMLLGSLIWVGELVLRPPSIVPRASVISSRA